MTGKLLKKELRLCLHPTAPLMLALAALILTPNYPYMVSYFYLTLSFFFICLTARENHDVTFTMTLPVARKDIVTARIALFVLFELAQLALAGVCVALHGVLLPRTANAAGMDANLVLIGEGFLYFGVFHLVFLPAYFKNTDRVGAAFVRSSIAGFLLVILEIAAAYAVPFVRDMLDTPDPEHLGVKLCITLTCAVFYAAVTFLSWRMAQKRFESLDIR